MPKSINGLKLIIVMLMDEVDIILTSRSRLSTSTHKRNWKKLVDCSSFEIEKKFAEIEMIV